MLCDQQDSQDALLNPYWAAAEQLAHYLQQGRVASSAAPNAVAKAWQAIHEAQKYEPSSFDTMQAAEELARGQQQGWAASSAVYEAMVTATCEAGHLAEAIEIVNRMKVFPTGCRTLVTNC